jgi:hypothetical protein
MSAREYIGVDWIGNPKENNRIKDRERRTDETAIQFDGQ